MLARVESVGKAAPPVSRFFAEDPEMPHGKFGPGGGGGGHMGQVLADICTQGKTTGYLEPTQ
jgi:hypothetical protein